MGNEKVAKANESKSAKAGVEGSKTPKGKGGGKGGDGKSLKSTKGKAAKSGKDVSPAPFVPAPLGPGCGCYTPGNGGNVVASCENLSIDGTCVVPATWSLNCCG